MSAHKFIADVGDYEIWLAPDGKYKVYSAVALVALCRTEDEARDWAVRNAA